MGFFFPTQNANANLVQLIKPALRDHEIAEFLWKHLEKDVTLLGKALGRSVDEAVLVIHLVLRNILVKDLPTSQQIFFSLVDCINGFPPHADDTTRGLGTLARRDARDKWELLINQTYIQPFLKVCICITYCSSGFLIIKCIV